MESGERIDDLQVNGWSVYQSEADWRFSRDTVLLADYCRVRKHERILDLGMGDGALSFLLLAKEPTASLLGVECREAAVIRARKGIAHNGLEKRCEAVPGRVEDYRALIQPEKFTLVAANPPYAFPAQEDQKHIGCRAMAPEELMIWCRAAGWALKNHGRMCAVYPCANIQDMLFAMKEAGLILKKLEFIGKRLFLAEAVKAARPGGVSVRFRTGKAEVR